MFVIAALALLWFRKGWLVTWCLVGSVSLFSALPMKAEAADWQIADLWLTGDQQGWVWFKKAEYTKAAEAFDSNSWRATAHFLAGNYSAAEQYYLRTDSLSARFGAASALAHQREYVAAKRMFADILAESPDFPGAKHNYQLMVEIITFIEQHTKSQGESAERQSSKELGDKPKTSEGAEATVQRDQLIEETLSSEEILNDPGMNEKWMRRVGSDLSGFLQMKFVLQLDKRQEIPREQQPGSQQ